MLSELHAVARDVTAALEEFDTAAAGRRLAAFIDDLSNWYVRRSRRRFWDGPGRAEGAAAFATLYECLETLTRLMAPFVPFLTDYVWGVLRDPADAGLGAPGLVAGRRRGADRRGAVGADGAGPAAGGAGPFGPGRRRRCGRASRWPGR